MGAEQPDRGLRRLWTTEERKELSERQVAIATTPSDNSRRNSVVPWCTLTIGRSSARVGPRVTTTTGTARLTACRTKRKPDITVNEEPRTSTASRPGSRESTAA